MKTLNKIILMSLAAGTIVYSGCAQPPTDTGPIQQEQGPPAVYNQNRSQPPTLSISPENKPNLSSVKTPAEGILYYPLVSVPDNGTTLDYELASKSRKAAEYALTQLYTSGITIVSIRKDIDEQYINVKIPIGDYEYSIAVGNKNSDQIVKMPHDESDIKDYIYISKVPLQGDRDNKSGDYDDSGLDGNPNTVFGPPINGIPSILNPKKAKPEFIKALDEIIKFYENHNPN